jgi:uncharacterized protein YggT (Ycf19 family)
MTTIIIAILLLLDLLFYATFLDVILSWLTLLWLNLRPKLLASIMDPFYTKIKKTIPTTFWPFEFTPLILMFILMIIQWLIASYDYDTFSYYRTLIDF